MPGAENVWNCITSYRRDTANEILRDYGTSANVIAQLEKYHLKNAYHGHQSGGGGDGTNQGADQNLDAAIAYLRANKPTVAYVPPPAAAGNKALKNASIKSNDSITAKMNEYKNLGDLRAMLDREVPGWKENRTLWNHYASIYKNKKHTEPKK